MSYRSNGPSGWLAVATEMHSCVPGPSMCAA